MRALSVFGAMFFLSACATVSVQPASITTSLVETDSALATKAKSFSKTMENEGWVNKNRPLVFIHKSIFGEKEAEKFPIKTYAEQMAEEASTPAAFEAELVSDISSAHAAISSLNAEARSYLAKKGDVSRNDVVAFEDALVDAKKCVQSFTDAQARLKTLSPTSATGVETAIDSINVEVDETRMLVERATAAWQGHSNKTS